MMTYIKNFLRKLINSEIDKRIPEITEKVLNDLIIPKTEVKDNRKLYSVSCSYNGIRKEDKILFRCLRTRLVKAFSEFEVRGWIKNEIESDEFPPDDKNSEILISVIEISSDNIIEIGGD